MDRRKLMVLWMAVVMTLSCASMGWAATISGTITNNTGTSGRIYITVSSQQGGESAYGVSIAGSGAFSISGVPQLGQLNPYQLTAFVDTQDNGIRRTNDPFVSTSVVVASDAVTVDPLDLVTPDPIVPESNELPALIYQGNGGNIVLWEGLEDAETGTFLADKYRISWSEDGGVTVAGSAEVLAGSEDMFFHRGGTTDLVYDVVALIGAEEVSESPWTDVSTPEVGVEVSGTVDVSGVSNPGPLVVVLADENVGEDNPPKFFAAVIENPTGNQAYTITNIPPGSYSFYALLDMNGNGALDGGDIEFQPSEYMSPVVNVVDENVAGPAVTILDRDADAIVNTSYNKSTEWEGYGIRLKLYGQSRMPVNIKVSGPGLSSADMGRNSWGEYEMFFNPSEPPQIGDIYTFQVYYKDNPAVPVGIEVPVSVLLSSYPVPVSPIGLVPYEPAPTFTWAAPDVVPNGPYAYSFWLSGNNMWWSPDMDLPSDQFSLTYYNLDQFGQPTQLADGATYFWGIQVMDQYGNSAQYQTRFTPTSNPGIASFSPAGGLPGTTVTITGINFDPTPDLNTVTFNGAPAIVTAASSTSLTVTVPEGATTGKIQVGGSTGISAKDFFVAEPATIQGFVRTAAGVAIEGARVEKEYDPGLFTTTGADGSFTLDSVFSGQSMTLKITKDGYLPTYSSNLFIEGNLDLGNFPFHLYTQDEFTSWGGVEGKGLLVGIVNQDFAGPVSGVVVTAQAGQGTYPVTYFNGVTLGGTATTANGIFVVSDISSNAFVQLIGSKQFWNFWSNSLVVRANGVTETALFGSPISPSIWNFSPFMGIAGTSVTISGENFDSTPAGNTVMFNGTPATVTSASTTSLVVTVPVGATTGPLTVTTAGGTGSSGGDFTVPTPAAVSASPDFGPIGTVVTVSGTFPDTYMDNYIVYFDASPRDVVTSVTANSLTFTIPANVNPVTTFVVKYNGTTIFTKQFSIKNLLTLNIVGSGSVNDSPNLFACVNGTCMQDYYAVTTLTLTATPSVGYTFQGWSGSCGGTGNCVLTMDSAKNATATFSVLGYLKIGNTSYAKIQDAFDVAVNNDDIMIQSLTQTVSPFVENLLLNRPGATIKLKGGYDGVYGTNNSFSVVDGSLKIRNGILKAERLKIR